MFDASYNTPSTLPRKKTQKNARHASHASPRPLHASRRRLSLRLRLRLRLRLARVIASRPPPPSSGSPHRLLVVLPVQTFPRSVNLTLQIKRPPVLFVALEQSLELACSSSYVAVSVTPRTSRASRRAAWTRPPRGTSPSTPTPPPFDASFATPVRWAFTSACLYARDAARTSADPPATSRFASTRDAMGDGSK